MPLHAHPTDGRRKCLTLFQVQHLAQVHGRILQLPETLASSPLPTPTDRGSVVAVVPIANTLPMPLQEEANLTTKVSHLETQVALLQEQLTHLTSALLVLPASWADHPLVALSPLVEQPLSVQEPRTTPMASGRCPHPAESRRLPLLPLIEYGANGTYVVVCPQEGELHFAPDSPAWFGWLASLASFGFVGKCGRFTACRVYDKGGATRSILAQSRGTNMGSGLLRVPQANDARIKLEKAFIDPVFPQSVCTQIRTPLMSKYDGIHEMTEWSGADTSCMMSAPARLVSAN